MLFCFYKSFAGDKRIKFEKKIITKPFKQIGIFYTMKKIFTLFVLVFAVMAAYAGNTTVYTDKLTVTVNGDGTTQETAVNVEFLEDNYINFILKNFTLVAADGNEMYVGNIAVDNLFLTNKGEYDSFSFNGNLQIQEGDKAGVDTWVGPLLGNVPLVMKGKITGDKLYVTIDIDMMSSINQIVQVQFGSDFAAASVSKTVDYSDALSSFISGSLLGKVEGTKAQIQHLSNGDVNLVLPALTLPVDGGMLLGDCTISDVSVENHGNYYTFSHVGNCFFSGSTNLAGISCDVVLNGQYSDEKCYFTLDMDTKAIFGENINFEYGTAFTPAAVTDTKTYADNLVISVNATSTDPMPAEVIVEHLSNGCINFALKNFTMVLDGNSMYVGNILVEDLVLYEGVGYKYFNYNGNLLIKAGDKAGVAAEDWVGPLLGEIPLRLRGRITDNRLNVDIDIDMSETLNQIIYVTFGSTIEPDGINQVTTKSDNVVYDLQGRRVNNAEKGVFIMNGKKILK